MLEKNLALPVHVRFRDYLPMILAMYPVISSDKPSSTKFPKGFKKCKWQPIGINNPKEIKQPILSYGLHSPFVMEMVNTWDSYKKETVNDWLQLVSVFLEDRSQLLWKCYY